LEKGAIKSGFKLVIRWWNNSCTYYVVDKFGAIFLREEGN